MCYLEFIYLSLRNFPQGRKDSIFHCCVNKTEGYPKPGWLGTEEVMAAQGEVLDLEVGKSYNVEGDCGLSKSDHLKFYFTLTIRVGFEISHKIFFRHLLVESWERKGQFRKERKQPGKKADD